MKRNTQRNNIHHYGSVVMLSVAYKPFMPSIVMLNVVMLSVVAPQMACIANKNALLFTTFLTFFCNFIIFRVKPVANNKCVVHDRPDHEPIL